MASTYTTSLKLQLMATGENTSTWGNTTNDNLQYGLEQAIVGSATVTFASANVTLTLTDTPTSQTARTFTQRLKHIARAASGVPVPRPNRTRRLDDNENTGGSP